MSLVVTPQEFQLVFFDHDEVLAVCADAQALVPGATDLGSATIEVDETKPTNRVRIVSMNPIVFDVHSGALEDTARPRRFSELQTRINIGRLWFEALDRAGPEFGAPPIEAEVPEAPRSAWDAYCYGRVAALGVRIHRPRYLYNFYNRVGFTDAATEAFDELWSGSTLSYTDIAAKVGELVPTRPAK